jgi:Type I phosphodiesterase / nucleotide pyrophosphatase
MQPFRTFLRNKENWPIFIIPALLLLWAQFGAPNLGLTSFNSLSYDNSPYRGNSPYLKPLPETNPGQPIARHVVLIVIDALRVDSSQKMPTLNALRDRGADRVSLVGQPSFSLPGWTVIGTGAWQEQSGFATNSPQNAIDLDTIFLSAKRAGLKTALVGSREWAQLYDRGVDRVDTPKYPVVPDEYHDMKTALAYDTDLGQRGLMALAENPDFALLYFAGVDTASHGFGGASQQAADAAANIDQLVAQYLQHIDLSDTAVIVTSDHGQIDKNWDGGGGHGGWEPVVLRTPLIMAGQGIKPGRYPDARQADITPTIAALLGLSIPAHNQGNILLDAVDAPDALKAARAVDNAEQLANRYESMLPIVCDGCKLDRALLSQAQDALKTGDNSKTLDLAAQSAASTRSQWDAAHSARLSSDRLLRLPVALWLLIPLGLYGWWWARSRWAWRAPLAGGILYIILWNGVYFLVRGLTYSITMFNTELEVLTFVTDRVVDTMIVLLVVMAVIGVWRRSAGWGELARDAVNTLCVIGAALMLQILVFYVLWDVQFSAILPDLEMAFKYYMDVFQTTAFWPQPFLPLAALLPLVALLAAWIARRAVGLTGGSN